jgi:protein-serine/threonine kinase
MGLNADHPTSPGSTNEDSNSVQQTVLRFASSSNNGSLPKNKSTSNLFSQRELPLSLNTKRLSIDSGQLDRMVR